MSDAEYILRLIIRARDEFAAVFAKAKAEVASLRTEVNHATGDFDKLNSKITSLSLRLNTVKKRVDEARGSLRELAQGTGADFDKLSNSVDKVTDSVTKSSKAARAAVGANKDATAEYERMASAHARLNQEFRNGERDSASYIANLKRLAAEAKNYSKSFDIGSHESDVFQLVAREAEDAANRVVSAEKRAGADRKRIADQVAKDQAAASKKAVDQAVRAANEQKAIEDRAAAAHQRAVQAEIAQNNRRAAARATAAAKSAAAERDLNQRTVDTLRSVDKYNQSLGEKGRLEASEIAALRSYAARMQGLARSHDENSNAFKLLADASDLVSRRLNVHKAAVDNDNDSMRRAGSEVRSLGDRFNDAAARIAGTGDSVARLDNQFRGLLVLGVLAFAQQLISVFAALGGELVAVASSAGMAAAGIGGGLVAAAAQALPIIGLLAAAMHRVSIVNNALQKADMVRMQTAQRADKQDQASTSAADQLANAHDSLTSALENVASAQDRVLEARKQLNQAIKDGRLEVEDLIAAEKDQELAARGAAISQEEARNRLRQAVASGATGTELQRAELGVAEADQGAANANRARTRATATGQPGSCDRRPWARQRPSRRSERSIRLASRPRMPTAQSGAHVAGSIKPVQQQPRRQRATSPRSHSSTTCSRSSRRLSAVSTSPSSGSRTRIARTSGRSLTSSSIRLQPRCRLRPRSC
jgi:hypothetical protein